MRPAARFSAGLDYQLFVVTAGRPERSGCLVGFAGQTSIHPFRFLVGVSKENHTYGVVRTAPAVGVHVLGESGADLARLFGAETGDEIDKFERCEWRTGPSDVPVLLGSPRWFVGEVVGRLDLGDHLGLELAPIEFHHGSDEPPLMFSAAPPIEPGHPA